MKKLNRNTISTPLYKEKVLQFGGGNFLRAFVGWMIDVCNKKLGTEMGVLLVTPIGRDNYTKWQDQNGLYHVLTRGLKNGEIVDEAYLVNSVCRILHIHPQWQAFLKTAENPEFRFVISNTTEAGIQFSLADKKTDTPPTEFPAKLTLWLYHRYKHFNGKKEAGCIFIPVELILENGTNLRKCILQNAENWSLEKGFTEWINQANIFCNTLVDRIVPGIRPDSLSSEMKKLGYEDSMMTQGEPFHFWVIEGPKSVSVEFPLDKAGLNVIFTENLTPYRTRKVRILNGAHTSLVPVGLLYGLTAVKEAVEHEVIGKFVNKCIFEEIIPTLDLPTKELLNYANDVLERFKNPFIHHELMSISLNSTSKFKTRVLPTILEYKKRKKTLPKALVFSLAALVHFYKGEINGKNITLKDDPRAIVFLQQSWKDNDRSASGFDMQAGSILGWVKNWETDLNTISQFKEKLSEYLALIEKEGMQLAIIKILK